MKKFLAMLLAIMMVLAMVGTASAEQTLFTIKTPTDDHIYEIYQIFTGAYDSEKPGELGEILWGVNGKGSTSGDAVSAEKLAELMNIGKNSTLTAKARGIAIANSFVNMSDPIASVKNDSVTVVPGYYLIKDTGLEGENVTINGDAMSLYIIKVAADLTLDPKKESTTSEKKVKDTNDSNGSVTNWQDSADYDIGDDVPFQLMATICADYAQYTKYQLTFHDKQENGLTFNSDSVKVYYNYADEDHLISEDKYSVNTSCSDEDTFEVHFSDLKGISEVVAGTKILVQYTSKLNESAVIGRPGNYNDMYITYSNNPMDDQGGENGSTPDDTVVVFTYKVVVNKVDQNDNPLAGAGFTLYKLTPKAGSTDEKEKTKVGSFTNDKTKTVFGFVGLDDGDYVLEETVVPENYNKINDITFTVGANHEVEFTGHMNTILESLTGNATSGDISFSPVLETGTLTTNVENRSGAVLPETGGIGTTILYVIGGMMVLAAVVLLVTKRRAGANN